MLSRHLNFAQARRNVMLSRSRSFPVSAIRMISTSLLAIGALCGPVVTVSADGAETERLVQSTTELRTYVHFKVSNDVVQGMLPAGWVSAPGGGALKDANLIVLFVEGLAADGADGKA